MTKPHAGSSKMVIQKPHGAIADLNAPNFPQGIADRFDHHLTDVGRLHLLGIGLQICPTDAAFTLCHAALSDWCAERPQAPFLSMPEEAKDWAALASTEERKNYLAAIWQRLGAEDQSAFWQYVEQRNAA